MIGVVVGDPDDGAILWWPVHRADAAVLFMRRLVREGRRPIVVTRW